VLPIVAKVRRWWQPDSSRVKRLAVYRVRCRCGEVAAGPRKGHFQVVPCGHCGRELFVLPISPLPSVVDSLIEARQSAVSPAAAAKPATRWKGLALLVALAGLIGLALYGVVAYGPWWGGGEKTARSGPGRPPAESPDVLLKNAREHLAVGNFRLALAGLQDLAAAQARGAGALPRRQWEPLLGQASLLAELSAESLEEIVAHAAGAQPAEWDLEFAVRYRGKAFLFDVEVSGPPGGPYRHTWPVRRDVHMDFAELLLLRRLPLAEPARVLFGARLAEVRRDTPTSWEVRFEPASGVLITDAGAAAACCPFLGEAELHALVGRQAGWLP
jgi:hypothetical protein